ncbi:DNA-3-methyladenine glycosylase family protein [Candidatus Avelusimicrobium fimicolum]|uniref:DNA-3-methyladenine glycosylase family protein n=1 Tax=Candidatus Avelusimicrobium fimicolum TaxID=3416216 RepID=UPI003D121D5A
MYFTYGKKETDYLKGKCKKLAAVIDAVGPISRKLDDDLFDAVVHHIVGQQISSKAQATIWQRIKDNLETVNAQTVLAAGAEKLQSFGISFKKTDYILDFARKVQSGAFDLQAVAHMPDNEAIATLASLRGIGVWTAEMLLLFCLARPNVFSYDDLAIQRGLRMLYHHHKITKPLFEKYRKRFSPYGSVASLYLWAVSGGAVPGMRDYAPQKTVKRGK